jgi:type I restriction enzyme R subunit
VITKRTPDYLISLIQELCKLSVESEWVEFKVNNTEPQVIGEYISALSNSAALAGKDFAYLVWGVADGSHTVVGTNFKPRMSKVGNQELESWLVNLLSPKIEVQFFEVVVHGRPVVFLEIPQAFRYPVQFRGQEYVRIGSYKKPLKEFPDKEGSLWNILRHTPFESRVVADRLSQNDVVQLLDFQSYFELLSQPLPSNPEQILEAFADDRLVRPCEAGGWSITSLGGILFAKRLEDFQSLSRKAMRVIHYRGTSRVEALGERIYLDGYACCFEELNSYINNLSPSTEVIEKALRKVVPRFPHLAVRELVANALIHQDLLAAGVGPMVEIFADRIEITNPGAPLVTTDRFVDKLKSRNEALAALMRRIGICEERGSGWDKVVSLTESHQLPAPLAEATEEHTRVVLFAPKPPLSMDKADRVRAVYLHACLRHVSRESVTNASVRQRFGLDRSNSKTASRLIREAVDAEMIQPSDPDAAPRLMSYAPNWAAPRRDQFATRLPYRKLLQEGTLKQSPGRASRAGATRDVLFEGRRRAITDTSDRSLDDLIVAALTGGGPSPTTEAGSFVQRPAISGAGWALGDSGDYNREYAVDLAQLSGFLLETQPKVAKAVDLSQESPTQRKFLARLQGEVSKRGVVDVLRHGIKHGQLEFDLFYGAPSPGNRAAAERYERNRFTVIRQLRYSRDETQLALDLVLFINGLPVATFELKNNLSKQTVGDAVQQYRRDRDPRERLFELGRCAVHLALDEHEVRFCTHLKGEESWFLPFNQGCNDGAGNPPNPHGLKTDYLWRRVLTRDGLANILEGYAQLVEIKDAKTGRKKKMQIWPRYHQLDVIRRLLSDAEWHGAGRKYLVQHSAGSGKSNTIAWLALQLIGLRKDEAPVFDTILVVTDRRILDQQIRETIKQFAQVGSTIGHADDSGELRKLIENGKKVIITTAQKFPYILDAISNEPRGRRFAIIIDEAHSSQGGRTSAAVSAALSQAGVAEDEDTTEDTINRIMAAHKLLPNASYFAFTATPKNKTLEIFGEANKNDGHAGHSPFHIYTMKQAIQEGFILDVLQSYTTVDSYYKLIKTADDDPELDTKRAKKELRRYVEGHEHAIRLKAEIMVDHFHEQVLALNKIGGAARAMVVTSGVDRAIHFFHAISRYLVERKSPYRAIVAFSGEHEYGGVQVTEATMNGFPSSMIADMIQTEPYRFLICADKFQTGYDEPLLHTMYVDKILSGIKAVQTLSRLNRAHPQKHDVFVLDFVNEVETIQKAFANYYRTTLLSAKTDPNILRDLKATLDGAQVYTKEQLDGLVTLYLGDAGREQLDPILDACVAIYKEHLDEDSQVRFKGRAKDFLRTYGFLSSILPRTNAAWEKLSIFLNFLVPKLPAPMEEDLSTGIFEAINMDSYRIEKKAAMKLSLTGIDTEIDAVTGARGGYSSRPELDRLSNILRTFNDQFGNIQWTDFDRVERLITVDIPARVEADAAYRNAIQNSDRQNAQIEHSKALGRVMNAVLVDDTELFKQYSDNEPFRHWLTDAIFGLTYDRPASSLGGL